MVVKMTVVSFCTEAERFQSKTSTKSEVLGAVATAALTLAAATGRAAIAKPAALTGGVALLLGTSSSEHPTQASKAKEVDEEELKRQFVAHVKKKQQLIIDSTSANCSKQVEQ